MATNEEKWQIDTLSQVYEMGMYRIHFKTNPKFTPKATGTFYIGFSDMYAYKYIIREKQGSDYNDSGDPIAAEYNSIEEIVADGWRLD